jgi:hypothetical protein
MKTSARNARPPRKTQKAAADPPPPVPPNLATAVQFIAPFLDQVSGVVPDYEGIQPARLVRVGTTARFAEPLVPPTISAVAGSPLLQQRMLFDVAAAQAALQYRDALRPLAKGLAAVAANIEYSIDVKLAATARGALHTYHFAKRIVRDPEGAGLMKFVTDMKEMMKKAQNKRPKSTPPPATPGGGTPQGFLPLREDDTPQLDDDGLLPSEERSK